MTCCKNTPEPCVDDVSKIPDLPPAVDEVPRDLVTLSKDDEALKGLVVVYLCVGMLPPHASEAYVGRLKKSYDKAFGNLPGGYAVLYVPVRPPSETHIEVLKF